MQNDIEDPLAAFEGKELYELTAAQATEVLKAFLATEEAVFRDLRIEGLALDFSRYSVLRLFEHIVTKEFDRIDINSATNKDWNMRLAYYFGESLRRACDHLVWATGRKNYAHENHPVIAGFENKTEAPLITIARNVVKAVAVSGEPFVRIERAVDFWYEAARQ
jgi:hypothetical protein